MAADPLAALDDARNISITGWRGANHYRMQLLGDAADNPDQRIAEDINQFIAATLISIGLQLLNSSVTLVLLHGHLVEPVGWPRRCICSA